MQITYIISNSECCWLMIPNMDVFLVFSYFCFMSLWDRLWRRICLKDGITHSQGESSSHIGDRCYRPGLFCGCIHPMQQQMPVDLLHLLQFQVISFPRWEKLHNCQAIVNPEDFLVLVHPQLGLHLVMKSSVAPGVAQWAALPSQNHNLSLLGGVAQVTNNHRQSRRLFGTAASILLKVARKA